MSTTKLAVAGPITPLGSNEELVGKQAPKIDFIEFGLEMFSSSVTWSQSLGSC